LLITGDLAERRGEGVGLDDLEATAAEAFLERRHQRRVEFDGSDAFKPAEQGLGQRPTTGADLDDP